MGRHPQVGPVSTRQTSRAAVLARLGFADAAGAERLLEDPALAGLVDPFDDVFSDGLPDALGVTADPDLALLSLVRLVEAVRAGEPRRRDAESGPATEVAGLIAALRHPGPGGTACSPSSAPRPLWATTSSPIPSTGAA